APRNAGAPSLDRPARVEVRARALPGGAVVTAARLAGLGVPLALNEGLADIAVAAGERQTGDQQDEDAGMKRMVLKSIKQYDRSPFPSRTHRRPRRRLRAGARERLDHSFRFQGRALWQAARRT